MRSVVYAAVRRDSDGKEFATTAHSDKLFVENSIKEEERNNPIWSSLNPVVRIAAFKIEEIK